MMEEPLVVCVDCHHLFDPTNGKIPKDWAHIKFVEAGKERCLQCFKAHLMSFLIQLVA
jgi:hypothetical protein